MHMKVACLRLQMRGGLGVILLVIGLLMCASLGVAFLLGARSYQSARYLAEATSPSVLLKDPAGTGVPPLQSISFDYQGLRIAGWYVPSRNRAAVVLCHGVHTDRAAMLPEIRLLAQAGFGVLAFDWPGLGESQGAIRWDSQAKHALTAAIDWLTGKAQIDANRIGGLGFSIGGFVMTQVAAEDTRLRAVVIESAATEFDTYMRIHYSKWGPLSLWPARLAVRQAGVFEAGNSAIGHIAEIAPRAVFIIGQTDDPNVPGSMVEALAAAARSPKQLWLISGSQHGQYEQVAGTEYPQRLAAFFAANLIDRADTPK
jgi:dipeptidyl aminopeptidase/acylaminoacyl peptidase